MGLQGKFGQGATQSASIHILSPTPQGAGVALRVTNLREIERAFGWREAREVVERIKGILDKQFGITQVEELEVGVLSFFLSSDCFDVLGVVEGRVEADLSQSLQAIIVSIFLSDSSFESIPVVATNVAVPGESAPLVSTITGLVALARQKQRGLAVGTGWASGHRAARQQYRQLTVQAAKYLSGLLSPDSSELAAPICRAASRRGMYQSLELHCLTETGQRYSLTESYDAVVALGLARAVDEMRVMRAIRCLAADSLISLGVQISADSAVLDHWWTSIMEELDSNRSLSGRLYLELQPPFDSFSRPALVDFSKEMQSRGVVIVLDRFGAGGSALRDIMVIQPDYVKIEKSFLWRAREGMEAFQTLKHLVGLAHSLKAPAIVSGVDSEELAKVAVEAGAIWQCGEYIGCAK